MQKWRLTLRLKELLAESELCLYFHSDANVFNSVALVHDYAPLAVSIRVLDAIVETSKYANFHHFY